jgi:ABC-2 type transport system permease protein
VKPLISAELLKLRTTRSLWVATAVVVAVAVAVPAVVATSPSGVDIPDLSPAALADLLRAPAELAGGAALLVGLLAAAGEFRHRTVLTTRLVEPRQGRVLTAKLLAVAIIGLALGTLAELVSGVTGAVALAVNDVAVEPLSHGVPRIAVTVPLVVALHGIAGVAVGSLVRSTAGAVGATLVWVFVVEGVVPVVTRSPGMTHWLPGGTVKQILAAETPAGQLSPVAAGALLLGYATALLVASAVLDSRREI